MVPATVQHRNFLCRTVPLHQRVTALSWCDRYAIALRERPSPSNYFPSSGLIALTRSYSASPVIHHFGFPPPSISFPSTNMHVPLIFARHFTRPSPPSTKKENKCFMFLVVHRLMNVFEPFFSSFALSLFMVIISHFRLSSRWVGPAALSNTLQSGSRSILFLHRWRRIFRSLASQLLSILILLCFHWPAHRSYLLSSFGHCMRHHAIELHWHLAYIAIHS